MDFKFPSRKHEEFEEKKSLLFGIPAEMQGIL
jgi:hypothetical protein